MVDAKLTREEMLGIYRRLLLARLVEERIRVEYPKDEIRCAVHLGVGGEAIPVGVCHCLPKGSKAFTTYRNHTLYLTMTDDLEGFFGELYGKITGPAKGKAGSMHLFAPETGFMASSAVVGTTIPLAVGAGLANAYRQSPDIVVVFFGDGAVEEGVFWESLNFACLRHLRVLFVCEDNGLAIHTPTEQRQGFQSIEKVVGAYNCHTVGGNGADVLGVISSTRQILKLMSEKPGPGFLHLTYFRFLEHVGPGEDFQVGYRHKPTPAELEQLDPVFRIETQLRQSGCSQEEMAQIRAGLVQRVDHSVQIARAAPFAPPSELYTGVLA
jgi:pyruvate dehydrogenase E1 component alpha subunit